MTNEVLPYSDASRRWRQSQRATSCEAQQQQRLHWVELHHFLVYCQLV